MLAFVRDGPPRCHSHRLHYGDAKRRSRKPVHLCCKLTRRAVHRGGDQTEGPVAAGRGVQIREPYAVVQRVGGKRRRQPPRTADQEPDPCPVRSCGIATVTLVGRRLLHHRAETHSASRGSGRGCSQDDTWLRDETQGAKQHVQQRRRILCVDPSVAIRVHTSHHHRGVQGEEIRGIRVTVADEHVLCREQGVGGGKRTVAVGVARGVVDTRGGPPLSCTTCGGHGLVVWGCLPNLNTDAGAGDKGGVVRLQACCAGTNDFHNGPAKHRKSIYPCGPERECCEMPVVTVDGGGGDAADPDDAAVARR